jgi:signal transduction histidine kinase
MLTITSLTKQHGSKNVLYRINLSLNKGEVLGLAERSGDGVPALIDILAGRDYPDSGIIRIGKRRLNWPNNPQDTSIGIIYEQPNLVESLDIPSNIFLGNEYSKLGKRRWFKTINQYDMYDAASALLDSLNFVLPPLTTKPSDLTIEQKQLISIARVFASDAKIIVIQDPSRSLSMPNQEKLFQLIQDRQKKDGMFILCSMNLDHLFAASDRIAVLRNGNLIIDTLADQTNREEIVASLVGTTDRKQITPVIWALDGFYKARGQAELLYHNQQLLKEDLAKKDSINQELLQQLSMQVEALDQANHALQDAQRRLLVEREQERKHLSRELHDQVIQDLLSVTYELEEVENSLEMTAELEGRILGMQSHLRQLVGDLRHICGNLRPPTIDNFGLDGALKSYVANWSEQTGIVAELHMDEDLGRLEETIELSIFRIIQEGLSNIRNHANASQVSVTLTQTSPRALKIIIVDNGEGLSDNFDLGNLNQGGHYGLLGITERVALMGGRFNLGNQSSGGLQIQVEIPHPRSRNNVMELISI